MTNIIPANQRFPLVALNINNQFAVQGSALQPYRTLFIGPKGEAGKAEFGKLTEVLNLNDAVYKFGRGSAAFDFCKSFLAQNSEQELHVLVVDDSSFTAREETITVAVSDVQTGSIVLYIGGERVVVAVQEDQSVAMIATNIASMINANEDIQFSAAAAAGVVTLTAKNKGDFTNSIVLEHSLGDGESLPDGVTVTIAEKTAGAGEPAKLPFEQVPDQQFILLSTCYNDNNTLGLIKTELEGRNSPGRSIDGYCLVTVRDTIANLQTKADVFNSQFIVLLPARGNASETRFSGAAVGALARIKSNDPAAGVSRTPLKGISTAGVVRAYSDAENNTLLRNGISSLSFASNEFVLDVVATTYQTDSNNIPDISYFDLGTLLVLSYLRYDLGVLSLQKFSGAKIGKDDVRYVGNQKIVTPGSIKAEILARFDSWEERGLIEGREAFRESLVVERNASDVNRIDITLKPNTINELRIIGYDIQFLL